MHPKLRCRIGKERVLTTMSNIYGLQQNISKCIMSDKGYFFGLYMGLSCIVAILCSNVSNVQNSVGDNHQTIRLKGVLKIKYSVQWFKNFRGKTDYRQWLYNNKRMTSDVLTFTIFIAIKYSIACKFCKWLHYV